jgi:hypothetical protein
MNAFIKELVNEGFVYQSSPVEKYSEDSNYSHSLVSNNGENIKDFLTKNGFVYSQRTEKLFEETLTFEVYQRGEQSIQYRNQEELIKEGYLLEGDSSTQYSFKGF